jgi:TonB family protein
MRPSFVRAISTAALTLMIANTNRIHAQTASDAASPTPSTNASPTQTPTSAPDSDLPRKIGGKVSAPKLIHTAYPEYTEWAKQEKINGTVVLKLVVDRNGLPQNVHVVQSLGYGLDENAVATVKKYRFKPALEAGKPVPVELNIQMKYEMIGAGLPQLGGGINP